MPSQTTSPPLAVTVLAALWVTLVRCDVSESPGPGCDNGKVTDYNITHIKSSRGFIKVTFGVNRHNCLCVS